MCLSGKASYHLQTPLLKTLNEDEEESNNNKRKKDKKRLHEQVLRRDDYKYLFLMQKFI